MTATANKFAKTFAYGGDMKGVEPKIYRKNGSKGKDANGPLRVEGIPVFRNGTFRDSMGYQNTWETIHLRQMETNFRHLYDNNIFKDVPVRDGHPGWLVSGLPGNGKVIGYHTNLRVEKLTAPHDGKDYDYLLVDYDILDTEAAASIESGLWRNRSSEIGTYTTNDEAEYWPVYMGVAYVDIPAVEGLQFSANAGIRVFSIHTEERSVGDTNPTGGESSTTAPTSGGGVPFAHRIEPIAFSIGGQRVTDPAAVQQHIDVLEKFRSDVMDQAREDFVNALAAANKITAKQATDLIPFAKGLSAEQFAAYKATWEGAPEQPLLGKHGATVTNPDNTDGNGQPPASDPLAVAKQTVGMFRQAGMSQAQIEKTGVWAQLKAAGQTA